jgi:DNA-binding LytR/AlgR family response regulator
MRSATAEGAGKRPQPNACAPVTLNEPHIFIRDNRALHRVAARDILLLQADGNYVHVILTGRKFTLRNSLAEVLKSAPKGLFALVNRQQAVNLLLIERITFDEVIAGGRGYTLSPRYRDDLVSHLCILSGR